MGASHLTDLLTEQRKEIVTGMTFAVKDIGGNFRQRPIEEIYANNELYVRAHEANIVRGDFQPLVDFADRITRERALDRFRLHELIRAAFCYKKVVYPLLVNHCWEDRDDLVKSMLAVDRSVDRFVVNLSQAFVHYAKDFLSKEPMEFPVWLDQIWKKAAEAD
jgi:hypothetical protein